jgi:hypothetical protein
MLKGGLGHFDTHKLDTLSSIMNDVTILFLYGTRYCTFAAFLFITVGTKRLPRQNLCVRANRV